MTILVFNCGSSSLKFALFRAAKELDQRPVVRGAIEEIGRGATRLTVTHGRSNDAGAVRADDHQSAVRIATKAIRENDSEPPSIVAHRVVHGGTRVVAPTRLDDAVMNELERCSRFAPLHNAPALAAIRATGALFPGTPQAVVTDTAFHQSMPDYAYTYALPDGLAHQYEIRRFGFHGIGHAWMTERYAELSRRPPESVNLITLQLGAGCSAAAIRDGRSVDTSMGLTPLEGLAMETRSGDLDPAIFSYLAEAAQLAPRAVEQLLNHRSGLLGIAGISGDMRELLNRERAGDERAHLAISIFCYRVRKYIGAYLTIAGRTDAIVFGGGIGEHAAEIRARICRDLEHLGIILEPQLNRQAASTELRISSDDSIIAAWVIPLQEELYIARAAMRLIAANE